MVAPQPSTAESTSETALKGSVLDMLKALLAGGRNEEIVALVTRLESRNRELELLLAKARAGKNRGEHLSKEQLDFFLDQLRAQAQAQDELAKADRGLETATKEHGGRTKPVRPPRQPPVRHPPPPGLRRVENLIPVPQEERACPKCGKDRFCIGHETTEVIDLIPAEVIVRLDKREVLACRPCEEEMVRAPMGDKVVTGGMYGARLVAELVKDKYDLGLPLYRQGGELKRLGLYMPSSSMADQVTWATELLRPIWMALRTAVLSAKVMHLDGTGLPVLDRESLRGLSIGTLWGYVGNNHAAYLYTSTGKKVGQREGEIGPEEFLAQRRGYVVADAAGIFDASFQGGQRIEVGCNMHARRYFVKALDAADARAAVPLVAFKALYDVEDALREADDEARRAERQRRSKPVYDKLVAWCRTYQPLEPPGSLLGKAIRYLLNHRVALTRFLDDGVLPIDNGIVERLHRKPATTRSAYLFAGSHAGAERGAIAYSVLGSCSLVGVNPVEYLADVLPRLARGGIVVARDIPAMLPAAWKAARAGR